MKKWSCLMVSIIVVFPICVLWYGGASAEEKYPTRSIEMVIPFAPGGATDVGARITADELAKVLKVAVTPVNKPGASGTTGGAYILTKKSDGYAIFAATGGPVINAPLVLPDVSYDVFKDFIPVAYFASVPNVFVVKGDSPWKSLKDLIDYAKKNPGKVTCGSAGTGTESHINFEILKSLTKADMTHVPFKSGGDVIPAVLGGHVTMGVNVIAAAGPQIKAGTLKGLGITSSKRLPDYPGVPTNAEQGFPQINVSTWLGYLVTAGTPAPVVKTLAAAFEKAIKSPELIQKAEKAGYVVEYKNPQEFKKYLEEQYAQVSKVVKEAGIAVPK
ncbi:MAG TPA: tripartite tricarboxylate transporter substrate binding protein [Syntrophorhabdales bacterium]|nr:tripartite tricarboxylate transporter substrate binding protein [Syntrophorhabdales bacterium]